METRLEELIGKAREGGPAEAMALAVYLRRHPPEAARLVRLAQADEEPLRIAAATASQGRDEADVLEAMGALADDHAPGVREALATAWSETPAWPLPSATALRLLADTVAAVRIAAARAVNARDDLVSRRVEALAADDSWEVRLAMARGLAEASPSDVLPQLLHSLAHDDDRDVSQACAAAADAHLRVLGDWPHGAPRPPGSTLQVTAERVEALGTARFPVLAPWLEEQLRTHVDLDRLAQFGANLTREAEAGRLPRGHGVEEVCRRVLDGLLGDAPRAVVLVGDSGTGKTAVVHELVHQLHGHPDGAWHVLRVAPSEILVDTKYLGEWQTRVRDLVNAARSPRRVLLYVPDVHQLSMVGRSANSDSNVASMIAPLVESGDVVLLGETTAEAYRTGLGRDPSLSRLFRRVDLVPMAEAAAREVALGVADEAGVEASPALLDRLLDLAAFYMPGTAEPGRSIGLLRRVLERREGATTALEPRELLDALSATTGVPIEMLDDERALDLDGVRSFFEARVRGQPEAVGTVVDLVALIKAGLTDPTKPYGVLFFVGPTGVGKTELARALAELLFGDPQRLHRFDMSEYATFDAFERLIGAGRYTGLLTEAVRETPFSVFLLDEIEKAHVNVFDLCLQIFDAGRLTDGQGRVADYRRTIFVLTSNLGANVPSEDGVGFGAGVPPPPDAAATSRELRRFFRPEFLGRIDRVVHFRPIAEETAEWIARREVDRVLERSGLKRRRLTLVVDPDVIALLLRHGYSPSLGARPLKRTVERLVLMPVARAVAGGSVPPDSILRLGVHGETVHVRVEKPEAGVSGDGAPAAEEPPALRDLRQRADGLVDRVERLREASRAIGERREALLAASREPGFWDDPPAARRVLGEVHRWEGVLHALDRLERRVADTQRHTAGGAKRRQRLRSLRERLDELDRTAQRIDALLGCEDPEDLADAFVVLSKVKAEGRGTDGVETLARMYLGYASRLGLEVEVLDDHRTREPREDTIALRVTGAGAFRLLKGEDGLHQMVRARAAAHGAEGRPKHAPSLPRRDRELVRVEVLGVAETIEPVPKGDLRIQTREVKGAKGRLLERPTLELSVLHAPSMLGIRVWGKGRKADLLERALPLLEARLARGARTSDEGALVVRRYELGASPLVSDRKSGRRTGHLARILAGELDLVVLPASADA